ELRLDLGSDRDVRDVHARQQQHGAVFVTMEGQNPHLGVQQVVQVLGPFVPVGDGGQAEETHVGGPRRLGRAHWNADLLDVVGHGAGNLLVSSGIGPSKPSV